MQFSKEGACSKWLYVCGKLLRKLEISVQIPSLLGVGRSLGSVYVGVRKSLLAGMIGRRGGKLVEKLTIMVVPGPSRTISPA